MLMTDDLTTLRGAIRGRVITADDDGYDDARRVWNGMIDRRPRLIVQAADVGRRRAGDRLCPLDRAAARDPGRRPQRRRQRHRRRRDRPRPGPAERRSRSTRRRGSSAWVAARGSADVDRATEPHGLAVPARRRVRDGRRGADAGRRRRLADQGPRPDDRQPRLGRCRAGERRARPGERVRAPGPVLGPARRRRQLRGRDVASPSALTRSTRTSSPGRSSTSGRAGRRRSRPSSAWTADLPDELTTLITFTVPPPDWELGDGVLMFLGFAWAGADRAEGERWIARLQEACPPDVAVLDPTRWIAFQSAFDAMMPTGVRAYWRNHSFERLDPSVDRGPRRALRRAVVDRDRRGPAPHGRGVRAGRRRTRPRSRAAPPSTG